MQGLGPITNPYLNNNIYAGINTGTNNNVDQNKGFLVSFKSKVNSVERSIENNNTVNTAISTLPFTRRLMTVDKDLDDKDKAKAIGYTAVAAINLKEDFRDILTVFGKGTSNAPEGYLGTFKFFQGTFAEKHLEKSELGRSILYNVDKPISETKIGDNIFSRLGIKQEIKEYTKTIKWPWGNEEVVRECAKFSDGVAKSAAESGSKALASFGKKLLGHTLSRTTKLGLGIAFLLELPDLISSVKNLDAKGTAKAGLNSFVPAVSGALLSSLLALKLPGKLGAAGSIIGLGLGICMGSKAIDKALPGKDNNTPLNNIYQFNQNVA